MLSSLPAARRPLHQRRPLILKPHLKVAHKEHTDSTTVSTVRIIQVHRKIIIHVYGPDTVTAVRCVVSSSSHGHTAPITFHSPVTEIWSNSCMHLQHYSKVPHLMVMVCAGSMQTRGGPCQGQRNTADVVWTELDCIHTQLLPVWRYLLHLCSQACQYVDANGCTSYSRYLYSTFKTKGSPECVTIIQ